MLPQSMKLTKMHLPYWQQLTNGIGPKTSKVIHKRTVVVSPKTPPASRQEPCRPYSAKSISNRFSSSIFILRHIFRWSEVSTIILTICVYNRCTHSCARLHVSTYICNLTCTMGHQIVNTNIEICKSPIFGREGTNSSAKAIRNVDIKITIHGIEVVLYVDCTFNL